MHITNPVLSIKVFEEADIDEIVAVFLAHNWPKPKSLLLRYLQEQKERNRQVWIAYVDNQVAGYVTLNRRSHYRPFFNKHIPEIMDLNVLPPYRCQGIGSRLLEKAEGAATKKSAFVGIGVGLYEGYGNAHRLYIKRGYIPDGNGPTYQYTPLAYGQSVLVDDDLVLWFTKKLSYSR